MSHDAEASAMRSQLSAAGFDLDDLLDAAARAANLPRLRLVSNLGGSPRSLVGRVTDGDQTYVLKVAGLAESDTWARERCALAAAEGCGVAPRLLGSDAPRQLIVMTDLGGAAPVSDRLMGRDPAWADEGLAAWAVAVARLHDGGAERARTYAELLAECAPEQPAHAMPATLEAGATALARTAATLGVTAVEPALTRLRELPEHFAVTRLVLSPGDPCPDNNVAEAVGPARGGSVLLLDFEYAEARHPAWDVAYLTVPWPTCWCSWGLPRGSSERAVNAYLERAGLADDQAFAHDLALATQGWSLATAGRLLNPALEDDEWDVQEMPGPRPRAWQRLETAAAEGADEALATLAAELMAALQERWGPTSLPLAPAYRRNGRSTERR